MPEPNRVVPLGPTVGILIAVGLAIALFSVVRVGMRDAGDDRLGAQFDYDLSKYQTTDPALVLYREERPVAVSARDFGGIAIGPDDAVYLAADEAIRRVTEAGSEVVARLGTTARCLAVGEDGTLFAGCGDHVERISADGREVSAWDAPDSRTLLTSLAVDKDHVFAADAGNRVVLRYDTEGLLEDRLGAKEAGEQTAAFIVPSPYFDVAVGADGLLWVANPGRTRVEAYTDEGELECHWGEPSLKPAGFSGCCNPAHFACDPNGGFITSEKGLLRLKRYDASGAFEGLVAGPNELGKPDGSRSPHAPDREARAFDVAVDSKGRVLALDTARKQVRLFVPREGEDGTDEEG